MQTVGRVRVNEGEEDKIKQGGYINNILLDIHYLCVCGVFRGKVLIYEDFLSSENTVSVLTEMRMSYKNNASTFIWS